MNHSASEGFYFAVMSEYVPQDVTESPSESPAPSESPVISESPAPSESPVISESPAPSESPIASESPAASVTPSPEPPTVLQRVEKAEEMQEEVPIQKIETEFRGKTSVAVDAPITLTPQDF